MKIKIYPTISSKYTVSLPENIQSEDDVNSWIEENLMLVDEWEEEKNWGICEKERRKIMKIKIYPTIGDTYIVYLPENIQSEDDVNSWIEENLMLVDKWEEERN